MKHRLLLILCTLVVAIAAISAVTMSWFLPGKQYSGLIFTTGSVDMDFTLYEGADFNHDGFLNLYTNSPGAVGGSGANREDKYVKSPYPGYTGYFKHLYEINTSDSDNNVPHEITIDSFYPSEEYIYRLESISEGTVRSTVTVELGEEGTQNVDSSVKLVAVQGIVETTDTGGNITQTPGAVIYLAEQDLSKAVTIIQDTPFVDATVEGQRKASSLVILLKVRFCTLAELQAHDSATFGGLENLNTYEGKTVKLPALSITVASK